MSLDLTRLPDLQGLAVAAPDRAAFIATYGHLFEHSPWVVERTWEARPFADAAALHGAFMATLTAAGAEAQLALVRAHPELGSRKLFAAGLTAASAAEQAGAGLDRMSAAEFDAFDAANAAYKARFGFPFVICVRLTDRAGIAAAMQRRTAHDAETELQEALVQIGHIVRLRLGDIDPFAAHNARLAHDLACLAFPEPWLPQDSAPDGSAVLDVAIVGGGQCGLAAAFGLKREGVTNIRVFDENPAGQEGPWVSYARMITLRTPKHLTPIDFGIPSLTYRAWWEAQRGAEGWAAVDKIRRQDWMAYLCWYRRALDLPVENAARVTAIVPEDGLHRLTVDTAEGSRSVYARKVVLATGIQGGGGWHVPAFIAGALPKTLYAHTAEAVDFAALKGRRIAILGGGASAFDNAQHALGEGAGAVDIYIRRPALPQVNPIRYLEKAGILRNFPLLDDARKYRVIDHFLRHAQPPTVDTYRRATAYPNCALHLGKGWTRVAPAPGGGVDLVLSDGSSAHADYLIVSTGLKNDAGLRPELAAYRDAIALWDSHAPELPPEARNPVLDEHPYLRPDFGFTPREAGDAARLHGLFVFNYSALASLGLSASALSGLKPALPRLISGIVGQLFLDRQDRLIGDYLAYADVEFDPS